MEEEVRDILRNSLSEQKPEREKTGLDLFNEIRALFEPLGGIELEIPPRQPGRKPPDFNEVAKDDE